MPSKTTLHVRDVELSASALDLRGRTGPAHEASALTSVGQGDKASVPAVLGDEAFDRGSHGPPVAPDVADERHRDPVEDPVAGVLPTAVAPTLGQIEPARAAPPPSPGRVLVVAACVLSQV